MDHLATRKERQDRWYASHVKPRYLPVVEQPSEHENFIDVGLDVDAGCIVGIPASLFSNDTTVAATQKHPSAAASSQLLHHALQRDGFAVITGALTRNECERALELVWDYLEAASLVERQLQEQQLNQTKKAPLVSQVVVRRDDPQTVLSSPYFPATVEGGILPYYGAGHSTFMWYLRSRAVVQDIFATLHGVSREELITSLDGCVAWRGSSGSRNDENRTDHGWFHVDQNPQRKPDFCAVQGLVNLLPVTERTGGNVLVTGSHKVFPVHYVTDNGRSFNDSESPPPSDSCRDFYRARLEEVEGDDWLEIDPTDARILGNRKKVVTCLLRPGDVLLWDSRTVHCSCPGIKEKEEEKDCSEDGGGAATEGTKRNTDCGLTTGKKIESTNGLIRAAGLVTMMKRSSASKGVIAERKRAVRTSRSLTHWANQATPLGEERPEEVALETQRSSLMRNLTSLQQQGDIDSKKKPRSVLLTWDDLTFFQQRLVG